jgi:hypothetical protein
VTGKVRTWRWRVGRRTAGGIGVGILVTGGAIAAAATYSPSPKVTVNTGTLEVLKPASCNVPLTVTITKLYIFGDYTLLTHQRPLSERMGGDRLVFHLPFGMYRVRTSVDRSVENRFVLPGVVNSVEICKAVDEIYAPSPHGV